MCTKKQIQEAKKYLGEQGYGTGSNFTVNAVANLMAEWAAKNCTIPIVTTTEGKFCPECGKRKKMKGDGTLELLCEC